MFPGSRRRGNRKIFNAICVPAVLKRHDMNWNKRSQLEREGEPRKGVQDKVRRKGEKGQREDEDECAACKLLI